MDIPKVIISGASGFIGKRLTKELMFKGVEVIVLPHLELLSMEEDYYLRYQWKETMKKMESAIFLHLAWNVNSNSWRDTPSQKSLIRNTQIFLEITSNFEYILATGSSQEYVAKSVALDENAELAYDYDYLIDKHKMREVLSSHSETTNTTFSWVRLFNIYGPGDHPNRIVNQLLRSSRNGEDFKLLNPHYAIDLLYVQDAVDAIINLVVKRGKGIFNLGSGIPITPLAIKEYIESNKKIDFESNYMEISSSSFTFGHIADIGKMNEYEWSPKYSLSRELLHMYANLNTKVE
jgi:nucleoside-diphosphate-sugar epimerase